MIDKRLIAFVLLVAAPAAGDVPFWAPRSAFAGGYLNQAVTPQLRLGWEAAVLEQKNDQLVLLFEGGGGYGLPPLPSNAGESGHRQLTLFYQHALMAGVGYRLTRPSGFHFGFQLATGPLFFGARYPDGPSENKVLGFLEGRLQVGMKAGGAVYGLSVGYGSAYEAPRRSDAYDYVGGPMLGLFANWR